MRKYKNKGLLHVGAAALLYAKMEYNLDIAEISTQYTWMLISAIDVVRLARSLVIYETSIYYNSYYNYLISYVKIKSTVFSIYTSMYFNEVFTVTEKMAGFLYI